MVGAAPTAVFDLYYVMVEVVFGSVLVSGLAMAFIISIVCLLGRVSLFTTFLWVLFYFMVFSISYIGGIALGISFLVAFVYMSIAIVRFFYPVDV